MNPLEILLFAAPTAFAAIGECIVQKSGQINIGLEGTMLTAAFVGFASARMGLPPEMGLLLGATIGLLLSLGQGLLTISKGADQIVVGTAINLFALGVTGTLFRQQMSRSSELVTVQRLPQWQGIDLGLVILVFAVIAAEIVLKQTRWGLALRACGQSPSAVEAAGFSVFRLRFQSAAIAGALAGLGGAYLTLGVAGSFAENGTLGRGFLALAIVTFGRWKPKWVFSAALLIGLLESLQYKLQAVGVAVPKPLLLALPYAASLLLLALIGGKSLAPIALGQPYVRKR